jgi:hypothetical protein
VAKALCYYWAWGSVVAKALHYYWAWGGVVAKALCYYLEGPRINPLWCHWRFFPGICQFHVLGVDSVSKNEYQNTPGGKDSHCVRLTTYHLQVPMSQNLGALTSHNPLGPIGL